MKTKNKSAGFSLVELMVVVAIIGILATIAIPNYLKFQAKAKQSNAKSELAGLYTAEKAFFVEYNQFHANLVYVGWVPDGLGTPANACPTAGAATIRIYETGFRGVAPAAAVAGTTLPAGCAGVASTAYENYFPAVNSTVPAAAPTVPAPAMGAAPPTTFTATSQGTVSRGNGRVDTWSIDDQRNLINSVQGI